MRCFRPAGRFPYPTNERPRLAGLAALALVLALACGGRDGGPGVYPARGVVVEVDRETRQVLVDHEDVPGLMPAMTMNFDVPDPAVLERLAPGQEIAFELEFTGKSFRVKSAEVVGSGGSQGLRAGISGAAPVDEPAPPFALTDQDGRPVALADLRGHALLVDFIFTNCPGPCPLQTALHAQVLDAVPPEARARVHFVSISLDPERDTPAALRRYAERHGADLAHWSFLTGEPAAVDDVLARYGVGRRPGADGQIEHLLVSFLIDPEGHLVKRYMGLEHPVEEMAGDLAKLAS
jgi:protein SCO1/2